MLQKYRLVIVLVALLNTYCIHALNASNTIVTTTEDLPIVTWTKIDVLCFGNSTGSIDLTVTGGTGLTYTWSTADGSGLVITDEDQSGLSAGTYNVTISDDNNWFSIESITINEPMDLSCSVVQNSPVSMNGGNDGQATVTPIGGVGPYAYAWDNTESTTTALNFDDVDNYVDCGNAFSLTSYTKEAWIKYNGPNDQNNVMSGRTSNSHAFWAPGGKIKAGHSSPFSTIQDGITLPFNEWVHYAVSYDGSNGTWHLYRNGAEIETIVDPATAGFVLTDVYIGAFNNTTTGALNLFKGQLDDLRIWSTVRTPAEIEANYDQCLSGSETGLVALYKFEDGTADNTASTGSIYDGTLIGVDPVIDWVSGHVCGDTQQTATALTAGLHTVTVTDANDCSTTCNVTIGQPGSLVCNIVQDSAVICFGEANGQATVTTTGGVGPFSYLWDNAETTQTAIALTAGLHSVTVTDANSTATACNITISEPAEVLADAPIAVEACDTYELPVLTNGNYFTATGGTGDPLSAGDDITTTTTLFVYSPGTGSCADVENSFTVTINDTPQADAPIAVEACDTYELPVLTNGNYFTATGGTGDPLSAGDDITTTTTLFVYSAGTGSCADVENSFTVTINDTPQADAPIAVEACDTYELPVLTNGNYFTATGGTGDPLSAGDDITTTTTLFVYSAGTGSCADVENSFTVTINATPLADAPIAVEACDTYELPVLTNGNYFTATGGTGDPLSAGDDITTTTTLFVYSAGTGSCADVENSFTVTINDTPQADAPIAVEACDSYELPVLTNGAYFSTTGGVDPLTGPITSSQTVFVYSAGTGSCPAVENSFTVTINDTPLADAPIAVEACDTYELPVLTNGNYFTATGGTGDPLSAGDDITTTTTLFVYSAGTGSCADVENSFTVTINDTPLADAPIAVEACDTYELPVLTNGNYFTATGGTGDPLSAGDDITTTTTLFVYSAGTGSCADVENSFTVTINATPLADAPIAVEACDTYELPVLTNGNYFTATGGTGDPLSAGDDITTTTTLFVYSAGTGSCADVENSFTVTINDTPLADAPIAVEACDIYELPVLTNGNYFTATGGTGDPLSAGDDITTTTTLFVYSAGTGSCADVENSFTVTINDTPLADAPIAVEACDTYELPVLTNGNYFTATGGTGDPLSAGDDITTTTTLFVYSPGTGSCADVENSFTVTINDTPQADAPIAVEACDTYELPVLTNGNYFTATGGTGDPLSAGDDITTTTTLFVYSPGTGSCADVENSFTVTINDTPLADAPIAVEACDTYELPVLTNGNYFTATGGTGDPLSAGDDITTTTTLFVYSAGTGSCADVENSFTVTINDTPLADAPIAVEACDSYELPVLTNGNYFTATGGTGDPLSAGDDITTTTTLFVYSAGTGSCADVENSFTVTINATPLADAPIAVEACDTYELPVLTNGNYFTATGGTGDPLSAGDDITTTTTLFVYSPGTGSCADVENSFTVTINATPLADAPIAVEACDSYELPVLTNGAYFSTTGGVDPLTGPITSSQTVFVYSAGTGSCPAVENSFTVTINDTPLADAPLDVEACDTYELPVLTNGAYFSTTGGVDPLTGPITSSQTVFVYSAGTGSCPAVENSFTVTINDTPLADAPLDVEACDTYELPVLTNGAYFSTTGGVDPLTGPITSSQTVFVYSAGTGSCPAVENSFTVTINVTPLADAPAAVEACDKYTLPSLINGNYFTATGGTGTPLSAGDDITTTTTLFIYSAGTGSCSSVENSFTVTINDTPLADASADAEACDKYTLPILTNGNYFTATGGTGTPLSAGDDITTTTTVFVYSAGTGSCADVENSFTVTINDTPLADAPLDVEACDTYELPVLTNGAYFSTTGGVDPLTGPITSSQTVFVYSAGTGSCPAVENSFTVTINVTPLADAPAAVEACDKYTLPSLINGNYFTATGGTGTPLSAGDDITTTTIVFVYSAGTGSCADVENSFTVTINDTPLADAPLDVEACDTYELPVLTNGAYFSTTGGVDPLTGPITSSQTVFVYSAGTGSCPAVENSFTVTINVTPLADAPLDVEACDTYELPVLTNGAYFSTTGGVDPLTGPITSSQTVFVYSAGTGSCPAVENSFTVTINDTPLADAPAAVEACDKYTLPSLINGNYFTATGGTGTPLSAGDEITTTTTLFIYSAGTGSCSSVENSFTVTINDTPLADAPLDVEACDTYELPVLTNGAYFITTGGVDPLTGPITSTQTVFVYSAGTGSCPAVENSFTVTINDTPLADAPLDVEACDGYELPSLTNGNYFTATGGTGTPLSAGDDITTTTIVFVYSAGTGSCADVENSFTVTINDTPLADAPLDVEACDGYELPVLTNGNYFTATGGTGTPLSAGDYITTTTTLFVYSPGTGSCTDVENSFTVTINYTPLADAPLDVEACDSYELPVLTNGNYFTAIDGGGTALTAGDILTETQTVYVYSAGTGSCVAIENSFEVTIDTIVATGASVDIENYGEFTGSIDMTITGGTAPFTFAWTGPDNFTASSEDLTDLAAGTYDLVITDANTCIFNYYVTISQPDAFISINTKVLLGGPYNSTIGLMNDDLRNNGVIPIFSPYADVLLVDSNVFNSGGLSGTGLAEDDIVDWIWIELRDPNDNTNIIVGQSALLQRDGDVVDLDGTSVLSISITPGDYYVGVRHRNHLGVLSMTTVELTHSPALIVDFTNSGFSTFGADAQVSQVSGKMALWAGNVNSDTTIQYAGAGTLDTSNMLAYIFNDASNFLNLPSWPVTGYDIHDVDMNGTVQFTGAGNLDTQCILQNILSYPGNFLNLSTWQILEQLPEN